MTTITELRDEAENLAAHIKGEIERFHARHPDVQLLISHTRETGPNMLNGVYWSRDVLELDKKHYGVYWSRDRVEYELKVLPK